MNMENAMTTTETFPEQHYMSEATNSSPDKIVCLERRLLRTLTEDGEEEDSTTTCTATSMGVSSSSSLPPWLQRYHDPTWLIMTQQQVVEDDPSVSLPMLQLQELEGILVTKGFAMDDIHEILQTILFYATTTTTPASYEYFHNNASLLLGTIDFVKLILEEQCHFETIISPPEKNDKREEDDASSAKRILKNNNDNMHQDAFASKPILLAGIVHFAECMTSRQQRGGIMYEPQRKGSVRQKSRKKPPSTNLPTTTRGSSRDQSTTTTTTTTTTKSTKGVGKTTLTLSSSTFLDDQQPVVTTKNVHRTSYSRQHQHPKGLSPTVLKIAASAATIKRAEVLASTILGVGSTRRLTKDEADSLQGLLLSSMEDWRALALRCIASLFRLQGILDQARHHHHHHEQKAKETTTRSTTTDASLFEPLFHGLRSPEVVHTAQESILVYGTLAQRLGLHALKAKIEERAFQILYQRQYRAVSSVYQQNQNAIRAIKSYLSTQIDGLLRNDASLMAHVEDLQISSRVKEPYSFWKKLLKSQGKLRKRQEYQLGGGSSSIRGKTASNLSFTQVQDGIALRVILKARKESPDESEETTRAREKLLCYYVQYLIRRQWPGDEDRVKDYIQYPKLNGYQSLHYTASLTDSTGKHFPFEVQIRSEEMHRVAEYGVAAHWDYKLASSSTSDGIDQKAMFAIEAAAERVVDHDAPTTDKSTDTTLIEDSPITTIEELDAIPQPLSFEEVILEPSMIKTEVNLEQLQSKGDLSTKGKDKNQIEYIDALVTARDTLVEERVYVFIAGAASLTMEQGQLVILDAGSTIHDALAYIRKETPEVFQMLDVAIEVGRPVSGSSAASESRPSELRVWRNGRLTQPGDVIRNGDVLLLEL
jgi:ppGpp synthetase/RelA/SpoT-type nucleotidyltranferase